MPDPQQYQIRLAYQNLPGLSPDELKQIESSVQAYYPDEKLLWHEIGKPGQSGLTSPYTLNFVHQPNGLGVTSGADGDDAP